MIIQIPTGKYVAPDGTLLSSSASAIISSDETTPFGCLRKAWFEVRAGLKTDSKSFDLGNQIHHQIEHYLKTGQDALGKEARAGKENIDHVVKLFPVFQVEQWIEDLIIDGVKIRGRVDFTGRRLGESQISGIVDWKSSSDIAKWSKTKNQLRKDTQMLIYRQDAENEGCDENLYMAHVYFGTVRRETDIVETTINRQQLSEGMEDIQKKLAALKSAVKEVDSYAVKGDKSKCGRCPYAVHCTDKQGVVSVMSSLTDRFKKKLTIDDKSTTPDAPPKQEAPKVDAAVAAVVQAAVPTATKEQIAAAIEKDKAAEIADLKAKLAAAEAKNAPPAAPPPVQAGNIITPPDQPKSDPKLAADPVPGFSPIPEPLKNSPPAPAEQHNTAAVPPVPAEPAAPRGKGRPPGAKNKPKDPPTKEDAPDGFTITRVKVSLGATVKADPSDPKCFEFLRADIGLEADVVGDVNDARKKMADQCAQALAEELDKLKPGKAS